MLNPPELNAELQHLCCGGDGVKLSITQQQQDQEYMQQTLNMLDDIQPHEQVEIPIAATIVHDKIGIIAQAKNSCIGQNDPSAHAEILALRQAGQSINNYRLNHCCIYVTLEPCPMCFYAILYARIQRIIFATKDHKHGILSKQQYRHQHQQHNHHFSWTGGTLAQPAQKKLQDFFKSRRQDRQHPNSAH